MDAVLIVGCALLGLIVGIFLPVAIERVPAKVPVLAGPFPESSRAARSPSGWMLALGTALLFGATAARIGADWELPAFLVLAGALVALSVIDLRSFLLPNRIVFPLTGVSVALLGLAALAGGDLDVFVRALLGGVAAFGFFFLLHVVSPAAMGFGDVKLSFTLGLFLGWLGWGYVLLGLFLGFFYGAVGGMTLIALRLKTRKDHVPFGPYLAAGTMTAILFGQALLDAYKR
jgi:leader peptidase (prepilin peptidase) / N-methyltransferase